MANLTYMSNLSRSLPPFAPAHTSWECPGGVGLGRGGIVGLNHSAQGYIPPPPIMPQYLPPLPPRGRFANNGPGAHHVRSSNTSMQGHMDSQETSVTTDQEDHSLTTSNTTRSTMSTMSLYRAGVSSNGGGTSGYQAGPSNSTSLTVGPSSRNSSKTTSPGANPSALSSIPYASNVSLQRAIETTFGFDAIDGTSGYYKTDSVDDLVQSSSSSNKVAGGTYTIESAGVTSSDKSTMCEPPQCDINSSISMMSAPGRLSSNHRQADTHREQQQSSSKNKSELDTNSFPLLVTSSANVSTSNVTPTTLNEQKQATESNHLKAQPDTPESGQFFTPVLSLALQRIQREQISRGDTPESGTSTELAANSFHWDDYDLINGCKETPPSEISQLAQRRRSTVTVVENDLHSPANWNVPVDTKKPRPDTPISMLPVDAALTLAKDIWKAPTPPQVLVTAHDSTPDATSSLQNSHENDSHAISSSANQTCQSANTNITGLQPLPLSAEESGLLSAPGGDQTVTSPRQNPHHFEVDSHHFTYFSKKETTPVPSLQNNSQDSNSEAPSLTEYKTPWDVHERRKSNSSTKDGKLEKACSSSQMAPPLGKMSQKSNSQTVKPNAEAHVEIVELDYSGIGFKPSSSVLPEKQFWV